MATPIIDVYSDIFCPFAYLTVYRLRQVWPDYAGRLALRWRALSLEYINQRASRKAVLGIELDLLHSVEPGLPVGQWTRPDAEWPATAWPAFEALACAQAQHHDAALAMSWALRHGLYAEGRCPALRHELLTIAKRVADDAPLDLARFEADWDSGRYKGEVIADSRRGWHDLRVNGSPTLVLPSGRQVTSPGIGQADIDEERATVRGYVPHAGDALATIRAVLDEALGG